MNELVPQGPEIFYERDRLEGAFGTGKRLKLIAKTPDQEATLTTWLLHIPQAHPFWQNYAMSVVHLRDIPGVPAAKKQFIGATHELLVLALGNKPENTNGPIPGFEILLPPNVCVQFRAAFDKGAMEVCDAMAKATLEGCPWIEPQDIQGAREAWEGTVKMTAMHYDLPLSARPEDACPKCSAPLYRTPDGRRACSKKACDYIEKQPDGEKQ